MVDMQGGEIFWLQLCHICALRWLDFDPKVTAHVAIEKCFDLQSQSRSPQIESVWVATESIVTGDQRALEGFSGFWCVPASPYRNTSGALWAIQFAREGNIPFLGTCGGFQHAILEYAHNMLGLMNAEHAEINPNAELPLLARVECSLVEVSQKIVVTKPGPFHDAYGADSGMEGFRCVGGFAQDAVEHEKLDHATGDWDWLGFAQIAGINFYRDAVGARKGVQI